MNGAIPQALCLPFSRVTNLNHFGFYSMLGSNTLALSGINFFAFVSSGVYAAAALVLLFGLGVYLFLRFRGAGSVPSGKLELGNIRETEMESPLKTSHHRESGKKGPVRPTTRDLARSASSDAGNFSKNYAESIEINHLPIGRIDSITLPNSIVELEDSDDEGLLAAIDEVQDDSDADSEFRLIALRVLASFKKRNAIDELSQIALYDLSSNLRSKAVMMLADFDHESVFEAIVLACADPSREVRAAGARALVKVTFDRADAWTRFAMSDDQYLSRQIARAAVEAGIAERSFDRLVLNDEKAVHEAFALVNLLIKTGETEKIFDAIRDHRDLKTRVALLHSIKIANVAEVIPQLTALIAGEPMGSVVADKAREALLGINAMPVNA